MSALPHFTIPGMLQFLFRESKRPAPKYNITTCRPHNVLAGCHAQYPTNQKLSSPERVGCLFIPGHGRQPLEDLNLDVRVLLNAVRAKMTAVLLRPSQNAAARLDKVVSAETGGANLSKKRGVMLQCAERPRQCDVPERTLWAPQPLPGKRR